MEALTPRQILDLWADYAGAHPIDRTLASIAAALPPEQAPLLADLPLGARERLAMSVRISTFGDDWEGIAVCPACRTAHEIAPPVQALFAAAAPSEPSLVRSGDYEVQVRAVTSRDQAAVASSTSSAEQGARLLLERCIVLARDPSGPVAASQLPPSVVSDAEERVAALDPGAEALLQLTCSECGTAWDVVFDAGEFLWREIATFAQRLLRQVHVLASAYGWRETDVLNLHPRQREAYLELVGGT
jgi:hypothetical protein